MGPYRFGVERRIVTWQQQARRRQLTQSCLRPVGGAIDDGEIRSTGVDG
jgi:hypothetical protein